MKQDFVHLHVHSEYSTYGICRIDDLIRRVQESGQKAVALTDHGVLYGAVDFYKKAKEAGIKPIIGCEVCVNSQIHFDIKSDSDLPPEHLILLCENNEGYHNLLKLVSSAWIDGIDKPRVTKELLEQYHGGLIALYGCSGREISHRSTVGSFDYEKQTVLYYKSIFGKGNFFLEIQNHGIPAEKQIADHIIRLSDKTGIPLVCTNDVHYTLKEDADAQRVLTCIRNGTTLRESDGFSTDEFYIKSEEEMRALFPELPYAFDNTAMIADRCCVELIFGERKLPTYDAPGCDSNTFFEKLCRDGLIRRYGKHPDAAISERLKYEFDIIENMGYTDSYLILWDIRNYAKSHGIPIGFAHGTLSGSLCAYCLEITEIDPIRYNLLFDLFINSETGAVPEFSIDVSTEKHLQIVDYLNQKYGRDRVALSADFFHESTRSVIRDAAQVMEIPSVVVDKVTNLIPWYATIIMAENTSEELQVLVKCDPQIAELAGIVEKLEDTLSCVTENTVSVIISPMPISDFIPLCVINGQVITQYPSPQLSELGFLKMHLLSGPRLSGIKETEKIIRQSLPDFRIEDIPVDEDEVYHMLSEGNCDDILHIESSDIKQLLKDMKPDRFEHFMALLELCNSPPMDSVATYIENYRHPEHIHYPVPQLKPILDVTYGCIIYQEQIMQILQNLAGYSLSRADIAFRTIALSRWLDVSKEREIFVHGLTDDNGQYVADGCLCRGIGENTANALFDEIISAAPYACCKAHTVSYALLRYRAAYLKCFYPEAYNAAKMNIQGFI